MLLGEDRNDPRGQRGQLIGFALIAVLLSAYFYLFPPPAPQQQVANPAPAVPAAAPVSALAAPPAAIAPEQLPPVAAEASTPEDEVVLENEVLRLVFTKVGARLKGATVMFGKGRAADAQELVPLPKPGELDSARVLPLGLRFSQSFLADALDQRRWEAQRDPSGKAVTFTIELPGLGKVTKAFKLGDRPHVVETQVAYSNASGAPLSLGSDDDDPAFSLNWGPEVTSGDTLKGLHQELFWRVRGENEVMTASALKNLDELDGYARRINGADWVALTSAYFTIAIRPGFEKPSTWAQGDEKQFRIGVAAPALQVGAGETVSRDFEVYIGPKEKRALVAAWEGLDATWTFYHTFIWSVSLGHFMDLFSKGLLAVLNWFHDHIYANYGVAIIFLTLLVRSAVFPLTIKSMAGMKKMQKLAPEMEEIKQKYKDNPQEQQQKLMELYRERGVNPVSGCFPLLLQMPVFFALYRMLWTAIELRGAPFFGWITDLSEPDRLFVFAQPIPLLLFDLHSINLLPLLMAVVMWGSTKFMPTTGPMISPEQKMMMNIMPVMFSFFCYEQAAGLSVYIITSTLLGMAQSHIVNRIDWEVDVSKKAAKPGASKKHWFDAALEKKKQLEKEQKAFKKQARAEIIRGNDADGGNAPKGKKKK